MRGIGKGQTLEIFIIPEVEVMDEIKNAIYSFLLDPGSRTD